MPLTFQQAPQVTPGTQPTSTELACLARAFNSRIRSGVGDGAWRIAFYFFELWRQVRNPTFSEVCTVAQAPPLAEFIEFYMHLSLEDGFDLWPEAEPGAEQGANVISPMMAFVLGIPQSLLPCGPARPHLLDPEDVRLEIVEASTASTPGGHWAKGKEQRGLVDPSTGLRNVPAFAAAQSHFRIVHRDSGPHGRSYGGFLPIPEIVGNCGDLAATPLFQYKFTPLRDADDQGNPLAAVTATGVCPEDVDVGDLAALARLPFAYYLIYKNATVLRLDRKDYIEGPYDGGGVLQKSDGGHLQRMLNNYVKDYRGSDGQRAVPGFKMSEIGFDFERFFSSQYHLAPNIAHIEEIESEPVLIEDYPAVEFTGQLNFAAGSVGSFESGEGTSHPYHPRFVLGGVLITATKLAGPAVIELLNGDTVFYRTTIGPDADPEAAVEQIKFFDAPVRPVPLRIRLGNDLEFTATDGVLRVECTEQLDYKPEMHDAYLVLRLSSTGTTGIDGRGRDTELARQMSDDYFAHGAILNRQGLTGLPDQEADVNDNPVFDAARQLTRDHLRLVTREQLIDYQVADFGNGPVSVLYFRRSFARAGRQVDPLGGIAPAQAAPVSGQLRAGIEYIVRDSGTVTYGETEYTAGQRFVAVPGDAAYEQTGDARPYEYDGIRHTAPVKGYTNEWVMFPQFKVYGNAEESPWKPEAYSDFFPLSNRCQFYNQRLRASLSPQLAMLSRHFSYGETPPVAPEAPSGYNYAESSNFFDGFWTDDLRRSFYRSCPVYQAPYEVDRAHVLIESGIEVVQLIFKTRFQHTDEAPAIISRAADWSQTDIDALRAEPYRTDENALREYLLSGTVNCRKNVIGDTATSAHTFADGQDGFFSVFNAFGACYPHLWFVHLVPEPYEDNNDTPQPATDTRMTVDPLLQAELYLRAMCEGFVDGRTSVELVCRRFEAEIAATHGQIVAGQSIRNFSCPQVPLNLYDYTFENLCFDAFGGKWINTISTVKRPDAPQGYGPLPATRLWAQIFNQLAAAVNLLTRARLMLPFRLVCKTDVYQGHLAVTPDWPPEIVCVTNGTQAAIWRGHPPGVSGGAIIAGEFADCPYDEVTDITSIGARSDGGLNSEDQCIGDDFRVTTTKTVTAYKHTAADPIAMEALAPDLRELVNEGRTGFIGLFLETEFVPEAIETEVQEEAGGCDVANTFWDTPEGKGWRFVENITTVKQECKLFSSGTLSPPDPPAGDFYVCRVGEVADANGSVNAQEIIVCGANQDLYLEVPTVQCGEEEEG